MVIPFHAPRRGRADVEGEREGGGRGVVCVPDIDGRFKDFICSCCVNSVTCNVYFMPTPIKCDPFMPCCLNKLRAAVKSSSPIDYKVIVK